MTTAVPKPAPSMPRSIWLGERRSLPREWLLAGIAGAQAFRFRLPGPLTPIQTRRACGLALCGIRGWQRALWALVHGVPSARCPPAGSSLLVSWTERMASSHSARSSAERPASVDEFSAERFSVGGCSATAETQMWSARNFSVTRRS
jgi:hypothetical protein